MLYEVITARYMNGASTNPDFNVLAHAGTQVKNALDTTIALGGENYVFWGGREGYMSLLNTDMKLEKENMARFLTMARDYARKNGFEGTFFIEPKPMEPSKHQYDVDAETVIGFLRNYGLDKDFKLNIEVNHATLAQHTFEHELQCAADAGMLGSIDANKGDNQNGWDTDEFPTNIYEITQAMMVILRITSYNVCYTKLLRPKTDNYFIVYYLSTPSTGATVAFYDGDKKLNTTTVPNNGDWDSYYGFYVQETVFLAEGKHTIKLLAGGNDWAWNMDKFTLQEDVNTAPNSIVSYDSDILKVYPNPFLDYVKVDADEAIVKIELLNMNGSVVKSELINSTSALLSTDELKVGIYLIKVQLESGLWLTSKVIKI